MSAAPKQLTISPLNTPLRGRIQVPGDKSISHRALMLGALAEGETHIAGFLAAEDTLGTLRALQQLGVEIDYNASEKTVRVQGVGLHGLQAPTASLDLGNSGTSMRLLAGVLAGQSFESVLTGDASLSGRPMQRVIAPLQEMGAVITAEGKRDGTPPLRIQGGNMLHGIDYTLPVASAQVKSCVLLAGLFAKGETTVRENASRLTRDHTERMLQGFGYPLQQAPGQVSLTGRHSLQSISLQVPADISSAAFFLVAASIVPGAELLLTNVGINPTRTGVIHILREMGAKIEIKDEREWGGEPVADLHVMSQSLRGIEIPEKWVPLAIDELPVIMIAAACAQGRTVLRGAAELRVKESDRIAAVAAGLQALGIDVEVFPDGMSVQSGQFAAGEVNAHGDHRIAMAFAIAALVAQGEVTIHDTQAIATSFPDFIDILGNLGASI